MTRLIPLLFAALIPIALSAQKKATNSRSIPYFECHVPEHSGVSQLPLKDYSVEAKIAGTIADVNLKQTFINSFNTPLEVTYVFPGSANSAVNGLTMKIGERVVIAEIQEKFKARETYSEAVEEGKRASLLEQVRPNVFQMTVGNIMPNDTIEVSVQYTEYVESIAGQYQFIIPTTIGERYAGENNGEQLSVRPSYVMSNESPYTLNISVDIASPVPIVEAKSNTHKIDMTVEDSFHWFTKLNDTERYAANRDFILEYRLRGESLASGILLHEGESENFFMLQIQPPKYVSKAAIPPREYLFVVDVSGSMSGFPLRTAKELMSSLLEDLKPNDLFNILPFAGASTKLFRNSQLATTANINKAERFMRSRISGGGTNMASAFRDIYQSMPETPFSRSIILITDGHIEAEQKVFQEIRENLYKANVFAFGIGSSVNHYLIKGVARAGMGEEYIVTHPDIARAKATKLANYIKRPALTNITIDFKSNSVYDFSPISIPDVLSDRPLTIYGKYEGKMKDEIIIHGSTGSEPYQEVVKISSDNNQANPALPYLWARKKIQDLTDYSTNRSDHNKHEITAIGLKYHLLTRYTSFVAVDTEVANISPQLASINQPLAIPDNPRFNNSYRSQMNATGAVSRATGHSNIRVFLPQQTQVSGPLTLLRWENTEVASKHTLRIENIFNEEILRKEVFEDFYWVNLEELNAPMGYYLIKILSDTQQSSEIGIKYEAVGAAMEYQHLFDLNSRFSLIEYILAIQDLYNQQMMPDALTLAEIAIVYYPDNPEIDEIREMIWSEIKYN